MARTPVVNFGSHMPVLIKAVSLTDGPILEMGMGMNSSLFLHWACAASKRPLVSYENAQAYFKFAKQFERVDGVNDFTFHKVHCIDDWDKADIEKPWDVAFLDHGPAERRKEDIKLLANFAKYIVIHDTKGKRDKYFHYSEIYSLFKWKYFFTEFSPNSAVLSNFVDLKDFGKEWPRGGKR